MADVTGRGSSVTKNVALGVPLILVMVMAPLLLLVLGIGVTSTQAQVACAQTAPTAIPPGAFGLGTLNWRGASHYTRNPYPGERPYRDRVPNMVEKIGASGASIIGFQEFESPQAEAFLKATAGSWAIVPGRVRGRPDTRDAIAYQPSAWTLVETRYVAINYGGNPIEIPLARFAAASPTAPGSGPGVVAIWVLNTHNPADAVNGSDATRDAAVRTQATTLAHLVAVDPATPVVFVGDMNDRARFTRLFLGLAGPGWSAANPSDDQIDWILGSPGITFTGTVVDTTTNDNAHSYTDHPYVHATVQPTAAADPPDTAGTERPATAEAVIGVGARVDAPADELAGPLVNGLAGAQIAASAAYQAGFRGADLITAVAIAGVESSWNPRAMNGTHYGLWQIGATHRGIVPGWDRPEDILEPLLNARYAYALYQARPGAGSTKFADWLPFETQDYRQYLDLAQQAVTATTGEQARTDTVDGTSCASTATSSVEQLSLGLSTEVAARISAMLDTPHGLCALSWTQGAPCTYDNQCPKVIDAVYGGFGTGRGFGNGQDVAQGIINAGLARARGTGLDPLPPVGAVVSYDTGDTYGHVAIYVGNGRIFGNDYGCTGRGVYGCVGFADVHAPGGSVTWALPVPAFDLGGLPHTAA